MCIYIYIYIKIIHIWWQLCFRILLFAWLFGWKRRIQNIFTWWGKFYGRTIQNIEVSHKQKATKIVKTSNLFSSPSLTNISQEDVCITKVIHVIPGQIPIHKFQNLHDFANFFFVEAQKFPTPKKNPCLAGLTKSVFCGGKNHTWILWKTYDALPHQVVTIPSWLWVRPKIYQTWIFWVIRVIIQLAFCFFSFIPPIVLRTFSGQDGRPKTKPHRLASKIHPSLLGAFLKISSLRFVSLRLLY